MSEGDSAVPALKVERRAWGQREFLERLISEHFVLITESEGGISWRVDAIDSDVATALSALSERLEPLGWLPLLEEEEPYILEITQFPVRPVTISKQMHVILWISSMIFLTLIGSSWAVRVNPDSSVLTGSSLASGFILYALPMMGTVALASILRRAVASAHGVRVDHLLPLSLPFTITGLNPIWPFGLVGLLHLRRVDQILFPDRGVLARVSIVVPATLIVSGIIFSILGLRATSGIPPEFTEMPFVLDLNWLVEITGTLLGYDVTSRSQWASPLLLAGHGLMVIGFILLLPIPNFPGDHLYTALRGSQAVVDTSEQARALLMTVIPVIFVYFTGQYWVWIAIGSLAVWRRFQSETVPIPLVLNEAAPPERSPGGWVIPVMLCLLVASVPSLQISHAMVDWDSDLDTSDWITDFDMGPENESVLKFDLQSSGVQSRSGLIHVSAIGAVDGWLFDIRCGNQSDFNGTDCAYSINAVEYGLLEIRVVRPNQTIVGQIEIGIHVEGSRGDMELHHSVILNSSGVPRILDQGWSQDEETGLHCVHLVLDSINQAANLSLSNLPSAYSDWTLIGGHIQPILNPLNFTENEPMMVCVSPSELAIPTTERSKDGRLLGPSLILELDDGVRINLDVPLLDVSRSVVVPLDGWPVNGTLPFMGDAIGWNLNESSPCANFVRLDPMENFTWSPVSGIENRQIERFSLEIGNGTLNPPQEGFLTTCEGSNPTIHSLVQGPSVFVDGEFLVIERMYSGNNDIILSNFGSEDVALSSVHLASASLASVWDTDLPSFIPSNGTVTVSMERSEVQGGVSGLWFEVSGDALLIRYVALCTNNQGEACSVVEG